MYWGQNPPFLIQRFTFCNDELFRCTHVINSARTRMLSFIPYDLFPKLMLIQLIHRDLTLWRLPFTDGTELFFSLTLVFTLQRCLNLYGLRNRYKPTLMEKLVTQPYFYPKKFRPLQFDSTRTGRFNFLSRSSRRALLSHSVSYLRAVVGRRNFWELRTCGRGKSHGFSFIVSNFLHLVFVRVVLKSKRRSASRQKAKDDPSMYNLLWPCSNRDHSCQLPDYEGTFLLLLEGRIIPGNLHWPESHCLRHGDTCQPKWIFDHENINS